MDKAKLKREYKSIPNMLGYFRILLIPVFIYIYFKADSDRDYLIAFFVLLISGFTDICDGFIARHFNMITDFGKVLDPIADKLTQGAIAISLTFRYPLMSHMLILFIFKEISMGILGLLLMKTGRKVEGARKCGKVCTVVLDISMMALLLLPEKKYLVSCVIIILCMIMMIQSLVLYAIHDIKVLIWYKGNDGEEEPDHLMKSSIDKRKKRRILLGFILACFGFILYVVAGVCISYNRYPEVSRETLDSINVADFYSSEVGTERARVIEDNEEALVERLRLIENAKTRIIFSTFDIRDDDSGNAVMASLIGAANRGVKVYMLIDGVAALNRMAGNPIFYAVATHENIEMKTYNVPNALLPWTTMGRMHDKYIIADDDVYILGGRNTFSYFLGGGDGYKNYDRDFLVYETEEEPAYATSINQLIRYFKKVWNENCCFYFHDNTREANKISVSRAYDDLIGIYEENKVKYSQIYTPYDYVAHTHETNKITLLSNPTHVYSKEPVLYTTLIKLMQNAKYEVKIHTPYIICNDYMYDTLGSLVSPNKRVTLMTNSVANNGNPFGASDYVLHKQEIIDTGVTLLEYDGGVSYHGKSITIDDDIAIVGSMNIDIRSVYLDTEMMLVINSREVNEELKQSLLEYEKKAARVVDEDKYELPSGMNEMNKISEKRKERIIYTRLINVLRFLM